jgi:SAM-dependent methyltransferase
LIAGSAATDGPDCAVTLWMLSMVGGQPIMVEMRVAVDIAKNTALLLPPVARVYANRRRRHGRIVMKHDAAYPAGVFDKHRAAVEAVRPIEGTVLEIGPGGNVAVAALFVKNGAFRAICIDNEPWLFEDQGLYAELGLDEEVLSRVRYESRCSIESASFQDASFEIIFSHACFEHIANPAAAIHNIARMLKPGGVTTHQIDLRDHRDFNDPVRFLKHRDLTWKLATSRRPATPNRWRLSDYEREFGAASLEIIELVRVSTVEVSERERASFAQRFRTHQLDDLGTTGVFLTAVRR